MSGGPYNYSYIFKYIIIGERAGARLGEVFPLGEVGGVASLCLMFMTS